MNEIIICDSCEGTGELVRDVGTHKAEYMRVTCSGCGGTGRKWKLSYEFTFPYATDEKVIDKIDTKIINTVKYNE